MENEGVNIPIAAKVDASQLGALEGSIKALKAQLKQAHDDFEGAAKGSTAWYEAGKAVISLRERIMDGVRPLREMAEAQMASEAAQRQLTAAIAAGVNPWTTSSAKYREAQAALQAQTAAAKEAAQASAALSRAKAAESQSNRADAVMAAQRQMVQDMREAEAATRRLKEAHERLPPAQDEVGKSSRRSGLAVLEFSRMVEDAQYGIAGILNNIPTLVSMLGMGAGLAGAFSLAAVGGTLLYKVLSKANFDGTWMGDVKDAVVEMVNGMSKAEEEARKIAEAPASWAKTAEEEFEARSKLATQALEREIELLKTKLEIQKSISAAKAEEVAHAEKLHKIQNPNFAEKGSPQWAANEEVTKTKEWQTREANRVKAIKDAEAEKLTADEEAKRLTNEAATARKQADDYRKREDLNRSAQDSTAAAMAAQRELQNLPTNKEGNVVNREREKELQETVAAQRKQAEEFARRRDAYAMPAAGDDAAQADERAKEKEQAAQTARTAAAKEAREFEDAKARSRREREINDAQLKRDRDDIGAAQFEKAAKDQEEARKKAEDARRGKDRESETMPDVSTAPAPPEPVSNADFQGARDGLANAAGKTSDPTAKGALGAMDAALADGKGDVGRETEIVKEMLAKLGSDRAQNAAALQQALREMESVQTEGSQMQQRLAAAFSAIGAAFRSMRADLDGVISEFNTYRDGNRR